MARRNRNLWVALAIAYFIASTVLLVGPVYGWLGNHIEPRIWGLPWSLTYVLFVVAANCLVLAALYWTRVIDNDASGDDGP